MPSRDYVRLEKNRFHEENARRKRQRCLHIWMAATMIEGVAIVALMGALTYLLSEYSILDLVVAGVRGVSILKGGGRWV